jgi:hypothetical protein
MPFKNRPEVTSITAEHAVEDFVYSTVEYILSNLVATVGNLRQ